MTAKITRDKYLVKLHKKNITSIPLEEPGGRKVKIKHKCHCGNIFSRSPEHMLGKFATGVCHDCHLKIKRQNKIYDIDNGYYQFCKDNKFSLPVRREDYVNGATKIDHKCKKCKNIFTKAPVKSYRKSYRGLCLDCTLAIKGLNRRVTQKMFLKELKLKNQSISLVGKFQGQSVKTTFKCICGEKFPRRPDKVLAGSFYCTTCSNQMRTEKQTMTVGEHNQKMLERGFKSLLISKRIINNTTKLKYKCECGFFFSRTPADMFKKNSWGVCKQCYKKMSSASKAMNVNDYDKKLKKVRPDLVRIGDFKSLQTKTQHQCSAIPPKN